MSIMSFMQFQKFCWLNAFRIQHRYRTEQLIYHDWQIKSITGQIDRLKVQIKILTCTWDNGYPFLDNFQITDLSLDLQ